MDSAKKLCDKTTDYFACRLMPHGGPVLFPIVLTTLALTASLADDGCDYARLYGAGVEMLTGSNAVPFVDCGMTAYRMPMYYPAEDDWRVAYSEECRPYQYMNLLADTSWIAAEWLRFFSLVVGGTTVTFLWTSTCLTLRPTYWKAAGVGAGVACLFQLLSFVWFYTKLCHTSTTNFLDFEAGREVELNANDNMAVGSGAEGHVQTGSSCGLFFGSKCAISSCVFWGVSSAVILLRDYPVPVPKLIADDEDVAMIPRGFRHVLPGRRRKGTSGSGSGAKPADLTVSMSSYQSSSRSMPSSTGRGSGGQHDSLRASVYTDNNGPSSRNMAGSYV